MKLGLSLSSDKGSVTPVLLGFLERANPNHWTTHIKVEEDVSLRLTASESVCLAVVPTLGLVTRCYFLSEGCCLKVEVLFLWGTLSDKDGSVVCSAVAHWCESRITRNHTLLSEAHIEVEVTLRLPVSQSVCLSIEYPCGTCDQIFFPVGMLLSGICCLVSAGRPL
jgi:hypothetical protein